MKNIILALLAIVMLSGCSFTGPSSIDRTNEMIQEANKGRMESFSTAMSVCDEKPGCLVAVSMAFAANMGQQNLLRPESTLDYIRELRNWVDPIGKIIDRVQGSGGTSGDHAGSYVKGDGNIIYMGNQNTADNGSQTTASPTASYDRSTTTTTASDQGVATGAPTGGQTVILPPEPVEEEEEEEPEVEEPVDVAPAGE